MNGEQSTAGDGPGIPDFLIKTALGCSAVVIAILVPFTVANFVLDRFALGLATSSVGVAAAFNVWMGIRGRYSLAVNTWLVAPTGGFTITFALLEMGAPASYWPMLLTLAYYFVLPVRRALFISVLTVLVIVPVAWISLDQPAATRFTAVLMGVALFAYISMHEIAYLHGVLRRQAVTDKLTGLLNRTLLQDTLQQAIAQNRRSGVPMGLLTFDIDHFKSVNDSLGHDTGDLVLQGLGELLRRRTRGADRAFRIGGEEFLILLHDTDAHQSTEAAEQLRQAIEGAELLANRNVTISIGVSSLEDGMDVDAWTRASDEKMYLAKQRGRNRVVA